MLCRMYTDVPPPNTFRVDRRLTVVEDIDEFKKHNDDIYGSTLDRTDKNGQRYELGRVSPLCVRFFRLVGFWFLWKAVAIDGSLNTYARRQLMIEFLHRQ